MLKFIAKNREQSLALEGLAYHIADLEYMKERFGRDDAELPGIRKTIILCFDQLDRLQVPFWVQNSVIAFATDWRRYKGVYMIPWLKSHRNIFL